MNRLVVLIATLALVVSACAAAADTVDSGADGDARETTTTQPSSEGFVDQPSNDASAPSTVPDADAPGEGSDPQVTEPPASEQPPTTEKPPGTDSGSGDEGTTTTQPSPATGSGAYTGPFSDLVATAIADLAGRLGVSAAQIEAVAAESVVWPDGALGCPQPDMSYIQVQVDGARIVLSVDGRTYNYHSGGSRDPFLCVPTKADPGSGVTDQTLPGTTNPDE